VCWLTTSEEQLEIIPLWVSAELLLCETPARGEATYSFELRWAGGAYTTETGLTFAFDPDPHVLSLTTGHVTMRAHDAGVRIGLSGWHFVDSPDICVRIAGAFQPVTFVNTSFAVFSPPAVLEAGEKSVFFSNNGLDFSQASSAVTLTFHADFTVESLSVDKIQVAASTDAEDGESVDIAVVGRGLPNSTLIGNIDFYCVFAPTAAYPFREVVIRATLSSDDGTEIICENVPTTFVEGDADREDFSFFVSLRFSYDLQEFLWDQNLEYFPPPALDIVDPSILTLSQSELVLSVTGTGILDSGDELRCRLRPLDNATLQYEASLIVFSSAEAV
jgi:hypothetical protein